MSDLLLGRVVLVILIGSLGAFVAHKIKLPSAFFLGPIIFIASYQIFLGNLVGRSQLVRIVIQIAVGIVLGANFSRLTGPTLKRIIKPAVLIGIFMLAGGILIGTVMTKLFPHLDFVACILGTTPGGQSEMLLIAEDMGVSTEIVLVLQLIRSQFVIIVLIPILRFAAERKMLKTTGVDQESGR
ncbi:MAG: AbrB family transcriptional regulator [Peptococcaceae bacterium]